MLCWVFLRPSIAIYHNHKRKNYRIFLFSFQFFIQTNLLIQATNHATNKKRELRDRLLLHCERISSQILTNNMHSSSGFILPSNKPFMYPIGTRIRESSSFKSLSNRCVKLSMPFWIISCILSKIQCSLAKKE